MRRFGAVPILLAVWVTACASSAANTMASGIEGQVLIGPMCPVVQARTPCPDQPYQAKFTVRDQNGRQVIQFQTDPQGNFRIGLKPGTYSLAPESPDGFTHAADQVVTVKSGQFTRVSVTYDSGIR